MAQNQSERTPADWPQRLRRGALFALFALVLLLPKALRLRARPRLWNSLRLALGVIGAFLLANKGGSMGSHLFALLLILLALLARPAQQGKSVDEQARALGALVVLNGGRFRPASEKLRPTRLFVAPDRLHVLDLQHRPLLDIPWNAVSAVRAEQAKGGWRLLVEFHEATAEFHFDGFFAEHLARIAETTLRSQLRRELSVIG